MGNQIQETGDIKGVTDIQKFPKNTESTIDDIKDVDIPYPTLAIYQAAQTQDQNKYTQGIRSYECVTTEIEFQYLKLLSWYIDPKQNQKQKY
ncbi:hypothetical protein TTHERM_001473449 (macronuclear) [Tetrahymena thermophila SB210]|uniref:Uncharacterized protein n=1 Tax=Tetrahymena thermophila (strain SB210) TaxID=312017 RepID=W7XH78_TETTS|nr:hypothetical protein TTHERM_001473449 [Tetrahymena thermophila SB210]EWS73686.1 hypothetical protein TTHERM_001473449 [Tetrahymena thermophila SB210]|eukprot:XP_012653816.1 hypothetical protein TTHERM_001473449 [Tetrahymena thermophila SB210]